MAVSIDGPVGLRNRSSNVTNNKRDQDKIITLLSRIPKTQGGKKTEWPTRPLTGGDRSCPRLLADAIWDFQAHWKRQGVFHNIDGVVDPGMNTLRRMNALAAGGPDVPPNTGLPLDIIVRFTGGPGGNRRDVAREKDLRSTLNTDAYLKTHQPIEVDCFAGFREQEVFVDSAVADVERRRRETGQGVTIVIGSSAGGVSALKTARKLTERGIHLDYVGISDAAFLSTKGEVTFKPFAINLNAAVGGAIVADRKENFFQTFGHELLVDDKSPTGFVDWAEFHGPLQGFRNRDLRTRGRVIAVIAAWSALPGSTRPQLIPLAVRKRFAALAHREAGGSVESDIRQRITGLVRP